MCGLAGILNLEERPGPSVAELESMARLLVHRGPDASGQLRAPGVGLVHRRLSIIDLAGGAQPMGNEDATLHTVFNGEIFNFRELREALLAAGHRFRTQSDTEVLVHLYEARGDAFVEALNGQFAIALWDANRRRLVLARDRAGILPLYWSVHEGRLLFASSIKAILAVRGRPERLSPAALDETFTFWAPLAPQTLIEGVFEVRPGELLIAEGGQVRTRRWWDWPFVPPGEHRRAPEAELVDELRHLLLDATRLRLRADVPVGAYLSGGLDSAVLTTLVARHTDTPLHTFSLGFEDAGLDERPAQRLMVDHLGGPHDHIVCGPADVVRAFADAVWHTEAPVLRAAPVPMMLLSALVRRSGFKVVLTGEGADELLGGYDLFKEAKIRQFWARAPESKLRPRLLSRLYPYLDPNVNPTRAQAYLEAFFRIGLDAPADPLFSHRPRFATTARCKDFLRDDLRAPPSRALETLLAALPPTFGAWHPFHRAQYLECRTLLPGYLLSSQGDRMLMANGVEGRFPFLDHRLAEFAAALPPHLLMRGLNEKHLLKRAFGAELPRGIVSRKKQPYRAPGGSAFLTGAAREETRDVLSAASLRRAGCFDPERVERLLLKLEGGGPVGEKDNMAFLGILSTQRLHDTLVRDYQDWARAPGP
jgi:asparagine synthase (glutamine-hydrolysing)